MPNLDAVRTAACPCGQLSARCEGEPVRISVCHCLDCKRRSGSAFAAQARWPDDKVEITGQSKQWTRTNDSGAKATFSFCPRCGTTLCYVLDSMEGVTAVTIGAFADPQFPPPNYSVFEDRKHKWVEIVGEDVERYT